MDAASEVKARLNIEDVVSQYVQLKRAGRNFKGLSPWTNEKTPSFIVSPEKQIWHDFSSGKGGDIFTFVMEMEGMDFRGALEHLARQAGVELEDFNTPSKRAAGQNKKRALEALELATRFYQKQLIASKTALNYLRGRKFSRQTLLTWQLGYAPNAASALTDFLTKRGFTTDEIRRAGLSVERNRKAADMFRGRLMIPLANSSGGIVGFTARLLADRTDSPKYINTPQTVAYDKSRHVFGLHLAKAAIRKQEHVVVVEGNMDVIASHQAGVTNVVASAGTAMTEQHLRELKRFTGDIRLCFDADEAGVAATERVVPLAQKVGVNLKIVSIKNAKDPDELVQSDLPAWKKAIKDAQEATEWLMDHFKNQLDLKSAAGKRAFTDALLTTIRRLQDPVEQEHYLKEIAELTDTSLESIKAKFASTPEISPRQVLKKPKLEPGALNKTVMEYQRLQDHFLAFCLAQPKLRQLLKDLSNQYFIDGPARQVFEFLKANPTFKGDPKIAEQLQPYANYVKIITLQYEELYKDLPFEDVKEQAAHLKHRLIDRFVKTKKQQLAEAMQTETDEKQLRKLMLQADELNQLIKG
jgi:DNA primase